MYPVLFHVTGIAILEICFYFYYIGPMETVIFTDKVKRLVGEPLELFNNENTLIPTMPPSMFDNLQTSYPINPYIKYIDPFLINKNTTSTDIMENLEQERDDAIDKREKKNNELFLKTLEYWILMTFICCLIYILVRYYKHYYKLKKTDGITNVTQNSIDEESLELVEIHSTYRRGSIDDEHLETNEKQIYNKKCKNFCVQILHYSLFGGCIICFQYLFFQNVVLVYDPLSIEEVKYLIYGKLVPEIDDLITHPELNFTIA